LRGDSHTCEHVGCQGGQSHAHNEYVSYWGDSHTCEHVGCQVDSHMHITNL